MNYFRPIPIDGDLEIASFGVLSRPSTLAFLLSVHQFDQGLSYTSTNVRNFNVYVSLKQLNRELCIARFLCFVWADGISWLEMCDESLDLLFEV